MDSAAFTRWIAFYEKEPFGFEWERWQFGMLAASIVNAVYATIPRPRGKKPPKPLHPQDFYPTQKQKAPGLTPAQQAYIKRKHGKRRYGNS